VIGEPARKLEHRVRRGLIVEQCAIALPADLDAGEQIGLGTGQPVQTRRS
jgi:hypothetical protein